jgi:hypothetical protein
MARKGVSVSIRVHPTIKTVIDYLSSKHRAETGVGLSNDEAIWMLIEGCAPDAVKFVESIGADIPVDNRRKGGKKGSSPDKS